MKSRMVVLICTLLGSFVSQFLYAVQPISGVIARTVLDRVDASSFQEREQVFLSITSDLKLNDEQIKVMSQLTYARREQPFIFKVSEILRTSNNQGFEYQLDSPFHEVISKPRSVPYTVLDVGCAYGYVTRKQLDLGAHVIAVDIEPKHLAYLVRSVSREQLDRLEIILGSFPEDLDFNANSVDQVLLGQVIDFMHPVQVMNGLGNVLRYLKANGDLFVMANTMYGLSLKHPETRHRLERSIQDARTSVNIGDVSGLLFPSYLPSLGLVADDPKKLHMVHPQDSVVLQYNLKCIGFQVVDAGEFSVEVTEKLPKQAVVTQLRQNYHFYLHAKKLRDE